MDINKTIIKHYNGNSYDNIIPVAKTNDILTQNNNIGVNNIDEYMKYLNSNISQSGRTCTMTGVKHIQLHNPVSGVDYSIEYRFNTASSSYPFQFIITRSDRETSLATNTIYVDAIYHKGYVYFCTLSLSNGDITNIEADMGFKRATVNLYRISAYSSNSLSIAQSTLLLQCPIFVNIKDVSFLRRSVRLIPCGNGVGLTILSVRIIYDNNSHYYAIENTIKVYNVGYDTSELVFDVTYRDDGFESVDFEDFLHFFRGLSITKLRAGIYIVYSDICRNIKMPYFMIFTTHNIEVFAKYYSTDLDTLRMLEPDSTSNLIFCYYINQQFKLGQEFLSIDYDENNSNIYLGSINTSPYSNTQLLYPNTSNIYEKIILKKSRNCYIMSNVLNTDDYALYYQKMSKSAILDYPKNIGNNDAKVIKLKNTNDNSFSVYYPYVIDSFYNNFRINNIIYNNTAENKSCFITIKI